MTTELLPHYLLKWTLSDPHLLAETHSSFVYTVGYQGETVVLKLLKPAGHEEREGTIALTHFDGCGAVRLLRHDLNAHLLEYADGDDLVGMVTSGDDEGAARIIADVLNQLHAVPVDVPPEVPRLQDWFAALYKQAEQEGHKGTDSIYVRGAAVATRLLSEPQNERVLHGDIHHQNIRYREGRGWLAFDPKGLYGERTYDAAHTLCNPIDMDELVENETRLLTISGVLAERLGIDRERLRAFVFAYNCLSISWWLQDGVTEYEPRVAALIEPHIGGY